MPNEDCPRCSELRAALVAACAIIRHDGGFMWPEDQATMRAVDVLLAETAPRAEALPSPTAEVWDDKTPVPTGGEA